MPAQWSTTNGQKCVCTITSRAKILRVLRIPDLMLSLIVFFKEFSSHILKATKICILYGELNIVGELAVLKEFGMFKGREIVSSETWF